MMKNRLISAMLLIIILGLVLMSSFSYAQTSESANPDNLQRTFTFDVQYGQIRSTHTLYVSIPTSLYEYYKSQSHSASSDSNYVKYVTSNVFNSIAENIQKETNNIPYSDEQFANAVLSMVRQIPYNKSNAKYPVEAIVENSGDCDVLSILAASIMKAGGLDVVLFHYKDITPTHMNIGVYLPYKPVYRAWWIAPEGFEYNNKTYWVAETTSLGQWKVGERPELPASAKTNIISLENSSQSSPGQISSSLDTPLLASAISITLSSDDLNVTETTRPITISGTISPALPSKTVTMYVTQGKSVKAFNTITDQSGNYAFNWNLTSSTYQIQTSCTNIANYTAAESDTLTVFGSYRPSVTDYEFDYYLTGSTENSITRVYTPVYGEIPTSNFKEFLSGNISGNGAALSGEFMVLSNNRTDASNEPVVMPETEYTIRIPRRGNRPETVRIIILEDVLLPSQIPNGQFGFILQQNGDENYSASIRILDDQDVSQITQLNDDDTFFNASQVTKENTWYKITATISENATNATICEENGNPLNNFTQKNQTTTTNQIGVLLAYNPGAVIAFRNLKVETLDELEPPVSSANSLDNKLMSSPRYVELFIVLIAFTIVAVAAIALLRKKRQKK